ncbi:MAG: hypothetical protein V4709_01720 [Pseudomonadota bacterium]
MRRPSNLVFWLPVFCVSACAAAGGGTPSRRDAETFILETLRKQEGEAWERTGQFMIWTYGFDRARCLLTVQREAELGDLFQQRIPLATASAVGTQNSEIVFDCRNGAACIEYNLKSTQRADEQRVARTRVLVMDHQDLAPLMNAFAELHQLCRDPYAPTRR